MKIEKKHLGKLAGAYSTAYANIEGHHYYICASENRNGDAFIFDAETLKCGRLWTGDYGVMNVIQIPDTDNLLAITKFYPVFVSHEAQICLLSKKEKNPLMPWDKKKLLDVPYVHRIGIVQNKRGLSFLIICTLCKTKAFEQDWSQPGSVYVCPIPRDFENGPWTKTEILSGLTKNHGLWIENGFVYVASQNGITCFDFTDYTEGIPKSAVLTTTPVGDVAVCNRYYATIEPFHGTEACVYDKAFNRIFETNVEKGHVAWIGEILGDYYALFCDRAGDRRSILINLATKEEMLVDKNVGATQVTVIPKSKTEAVFLAANHGASSVDLYIVTK